GDTTTGDTTGDTTDASTGTTDGTTGEDAWTTELCVEICVALTGTDMWSVDACHKLGVDAEGNIEIKCVEIVEHCDGRSHICIGSRGVTAGADPVAAYFARAAHDEAASVYAFAALEQELAALGAPDDLLARVRAAAADEVRHAQAIARLAADRGGRCKPPERRAFAVRGALEIAIENAIEGCVRETWAALLAAHQAEHAQDPEIRAVMRTIAADEARHAELAWAIDRWLQGTLDLGGQARVASARAAAAASIVAGVAASEPATACVAVAGVPDRASATRLCRGLAAALWAA
ncbi:MAG TPA: ferritin-like domain-containing protein, partial [Nannocystis sp.]